MSARIFPFDGPLLPEIVYLDTSFVWELYDPQTDPIRQTQCREFFNRLAQAEVIMVINSLVLQELRHVILMAAYRIEARSRRMSASQLFRQDKSFMPTVIQSIRQVESVIDANPQITRLPIQLDLVTDEVAISLMETYNLDSADAYHVAIAYANGINSFVTLDRGFGSVDVLNLYTCDSVLLQEGSTTTEILPFVNLNPS